MRVYATTFDLFFLEASVAHDPLKPHEENWEKLLRVQSLAAFLEKKHLHREELQQPE